MYAWNLYNLFNFNMITNIAIVVDTSVQVSSASFPPSSPRHNDQLYISLRICKRLLNIALNQRNTPSTLYALSD